METHLTIKHVAGYLPYGLKCMETIEGIDIEFQLDVLNISNVMDDVKYSRFVKPILRPLSDFDNKTAKELKKEFKINDDIAFWLQELSAYKEGINQITYETYIFLLAHHFDIHNLIKNNLAIDINTL